MKLDAYQAKINKKLAALESASNEDQEKWRLREKTANKAVDLESFEQKEEITDSIKRITAFEYMIRDYFQGQVPQYIAILKSNDNK